MLPKDVKYLKKAIWRGGEGGVGGILDRFDNVNRPPHGIDTYYITDYTLPEKGLA